MSDDDEIVKEVDEESLDSNFEIFSLKGLWTPKGNHIHFYHEKDKSDKWFYVCFCLILSAQLFLLVNNQT